MSEPIMVLAAAYNDMRRACDDLAEAVARMMVVRGETGDDGPCNKYRSRYHCDTHDVETAINAPVCYVGQLRQALDDYYTLRQVL